MPHLWILFSYLVCVLVMYAIPFLENMLDPPVKSWFMINILCLIILGYLNRIVIPMLLNCPSIGNISQPTIDTSFWLFDLIAFSDVGNSQRT